MKGEIAVRYTIRHFDLPLLTFEANMDSADTGLHFIKVYEENRSFLPLNLTVSEDGVERWLRHRTIPKNRAYVDALLSKVGLSLNARTLLPLAYDDYFAAAKSAMKPRHRAMLHKLLDFHFDRRATRYNLPPNRLKMIEKEVQRRARVLLG